MEQYREQIKVILKGKEVIICPKCHKAKSLKFMSLGLFWECSECKHKETELPNPRYFMHLLDLRRSLMDLQIIGEILEEIQMETEEEE